jgi:hypothetical protein
MVGILFHCHVCNFKHTKKREISVLTAASMMMTVNFKPKNVSYKICKIHLHSKFHLVITAHKLQPLHGQLQGDVIKKLLKKRCVSSDDLPPKHFRIQNPSSP